MKRIYAFLLVTLLVIAPQLTQAFTPAELPSTTNVIDETLNLSETELAQINEVIVRLQKERDIYAAVYLIPSLGGVTIESAALSTFEKWKLGKKDRDNGILFMFAVNDRKARIEVGYGLEGDITDLRSKATLDEVILPDFKELKFATGILKGLHSVGDLTPAEYLNLDMTQTSTKEVGGAHQFTDDELSTGARRYYWWLAILFLFPMLVRLHKISNGTYNVANEISKQSFNPKSKRPIMHYLHFETTTKKFLKIFLAVNPGVFIFLSGVFLPSKVVDELLNDSTKALSSGSFWLELAHNVSGYFTALGIFLACLVFIPASMRMIGLLFGSKDNNKNPAHTLEGINRFTYVFGLKSAQIITKIRASFFVVSFGYAVLSLEPFVIDSQGALTLWGLYGAICLMYAVIVARSEVAPLLWESSYSRKLARARLGRIKTRAYGTRQIFGKTYTYSKPSSSSGSSSSRSSSSSSSSGGGRSGGGGASSSW